MTKTKLFLTIIILVTTPTNGIRIEAIFDSLENKFPQTHFKIFSEECHGLLKLHDFGCSETTRKISFDV